MYIREAVRATSNTVRMYMTELFIFCWRVVRCYLNADFLYVYTLNPTPTDAVITGAPLFMTT